MNRMGYFAASAGIAPAPPGSYRDNFGATASTISKLAVDIGTPHPDRVVVVAFLSRSSAGTSVTIGGISAQKIPGTESASSNRYGCMWYAEVPDGQTADIVCVASTSSQMSAHVWAIYPELKVPWDGKFGTGTSNVSISSVAKKAGGMVMAASHMNTTSNLAATLTSGTIVETITKDFEGQTYPGATATGASSFVAEEDSTDNYNYALSSSNNGFAIMAAFGPPAPSFPLVAYRGVYSTASNVTSFTYSNAPIGAASADRLVVAVVYAGVVGSSPPRTISSATIGGVPATVIGGIGQGSSNVTSTYIIAALVPTGDTATVAVTMSGLGSWGKIVVYTVYGSSIADATPYTEGAAGNSVSIPITQNAKSVIIGGAGSYGASAYSTTPAGATVDHNAAARSARELAFNLAEGAGTSTLDIVATGGSNTTAVAVQFKGA